MAATPPSFGCGHRTVRAEQREGETVLELGSGIDVIPSAKRVGPT